MDNLRSYCPAHPEREFPVGYKFCDVCGQPLSAQPARLEHLEPMAQEPFSGNCPQCVTPYRHGWKFCKTCGASLPEKTPSTINAGETIRNVETETAMVAHVNRCPQCQAQVKEGMRFCQVCGHQLIEDSQSVAPKRQIEMPLVAGKPCPKCGAPTQTGLKFCQVCGAPLIHIRRKWMIPAVSITVGIGLAIAGWFGYQHYRERPGPSETEVVQPPPPPPDVPAETETRKSSEAPTTVTLTVTTVPPQSQVYLNDQYSGQTDANGRLQIQNLPKGKYTLKLKKEGYLEWTQGEELTSSREILVQLVPVPPVTLTVSALPGCAVYLDDRMVATTDANGQAVIPDVRQGTYSVKVSRDGYEDWTQTLQLTSSQVLRPTLARLSYERRVQIARTHMNTGRLNQALSALQELIAEEPNRPEGYELMGEIYDTQNNFSQAREMLGRAVEQGGQAQFPVTHDHLGGSDPVDRAKKEWKEFCRGELIITSGLLRFRGGRPGDDFSVKRSEIRETDLNKWVGLEIGAFNVKIRTNGRELNFNFAPRTKDRQESQLIIGLIKTYVR